MKNLSKNALWFLLITVMIDSTGLGIIIPVLPQLIAETTHAALSEAAKYNGILFGCYALMQFIFAPVMGGLSDQYGRRPVLLLSLLGLGIDYLFLVFAPSLAWMVIGRSLSGIFGSSFTTATAYISDISAAEKRAENFGLIGAAFGLGFIIGPAIGGLVSNFGIRTPFYISASLSLANTIYGYFVLRESLAKENRRPFDIKRANPFGALLLLKRKPTFLWLLMAFFLFYIANISVQSTWNFYTAQKFSWSPSMVGWSLAAVGVSIAIVQGGLIGYVVPRWGDKKSALIGVLFSAIGLVGFAIVSKGWMLFLFMIPFAMGGLVEPVVKTKLSEYTSANEQGELQGTFASLLGIAEILSPLVMTSVYYFTTTGYKQPVYGSPYYLSGGILLCVLPLILRGFKSFISKSSPSASHVP